MNDQPVKSRSSRDAELEALRQKSLVGTQRASLGSAALPEGMTLDKWMMQQRSFTEEERRKKNDAAKFLHAYRGKNVPVGTTPPSKMTPNRMEHIPPGPDEQQVTETPNADIKGIVAEFEKITTATTTSSSRIIASDSTRMTSTTTLPDGGGARESRGEQLNIADTMEENILEEGVQQENTHEIPTLYATRELQEDSCTAQLMILTEAPPTEEKEVTAEKEAVESSNLLEVKEKEELSTADELGWVLPTNEESCQVVEEPALEQILPFDEPTNTLLEERKPQLPLTTSREDPQATLTPQPQNNQIVSPDLQLGIDSIDTATTTTTPTAINDYTTTIDHPILAPKQNDLSPHDERSTNDPINDNNNIMMMSRSTEEVNEGPRHDNNKNQPTPREGSTKKVDVKVLLAVHVKKADADAVLSGGKQSILDSVIHVTENIVKKTIASSTLLDATGTFYNPTFRPTIDSVEADAEIKTDGGKNITRLIIRIVVPLFQLSNAPKKDKKQVINEVSEALKESVSDGRFAKDAKAFRKGNMYTN